MMKKAKNINSLYFKYEKIKIYYITRLGIIYIKKIYNKKSKNYNKTIFPNNNNKFNSNARLNIENVLVNKIFIFLIYNLTKFPQTTFGEF